MSPRPFSRLNAIVFSLSLVGMTPVITLPVLAQTALSNVREFNIPAGRFDQVLNRFGLEAGLELYLDGALLQGQTSQGLQGQYNAHDGLRMLLAGTGLVATRQADGAYRIGSSHQPHQADAVSDAVQLDAIYVFDQGVPFSRDEQGYNDVYDRDMSTSYIGKTEIERYKGANPADLLQGIAGVFSGDARNSGSMDPNIRGIQGPGRVPLTIDGTEQAITVWRGYNGATNRNYIDPNLLGSIQVIKGPSLERNVYSGVGGAIVAKTIGVDDIVKPGEDFGAELKVEGSSGSVSPRVPRLYTGMDYRDIPGFTPGMLGSLGDPTLRVEPKNSRDYNPFSGNDYALRLAVGKRHEDFDAMFAYAYRQKGNHYSGKRNAGYYSNVYDSRGTTLAELNPLRGLALGFPPGTEVMNTSSEMESWLGKLTWKISDEEKLSFTLRHSDSLYGEVMPSRIQSSGYESGSGRIQWPLSQVDARAYSMEYTLNPESNRWINFYSNLWHTDTRSDTYTAGGTPNFVHHPSTHPDDPYIFNTALRSQDNERTGITLSNKMALLNSLDLTLGGNWQYEKLRSAGLEYDPDSWNGSWSLPRAGRRQEWESNFNFDWRPTDRLSFSAGARYSSYWAFDDYLDQQQKAGNMPTSATAYRGRVVSGFTNYTWTQDDWDNAYQTFYDELINQGAPHAFADQFAIYHAQANTPVGGETELEQVVAWYHDGKGRYDRGDNPCTNGTFDGVDRCVVHTETISGSYTDKTLALQKELSYEADTTARTKRDRAWVPFVSATYQLTDASRIYFRYSEAKRYPSMFESTIGFSASQNVFHDLDPEHTFNYELAFIQDLTPWLKAEYADFKLAYFQHKTKNVIERDERWTFSNIEQQTIRGIETQARYDSGRFFADLGLSYILENEVCDEHSAQNAMRRGLSGPKGVLYIPRCVEQGFSGGYLLTQAIPSLSGNLTLGGRFLDRKLELGTRLTYYKAHENKDLDRWVEHFHEFGLNTPFTWDDLILVDAYASYKFNENMGIELTGTNLTDQYYVDPVTRSMMAAPGRVLKLSFNMNF